AVAVQGQRQHPRRRSGHADRPLPGGQEQRGLRRQVRGRRYPLTPRPGSPARRPRPVPKTRRSSMSQTVEVKPPRARDERLARRSPVARFLTRPEVGALLGAILIYIVFFSVAPPFRDAGSLSTVLYVSSTYGIPAVAVALLMIGGEFDLSAGVAVTSSALVASMFSYQFTTSMWVGVLVSLVVALVIGFINGYLVVKTGIPSFLVTLGTFFMLRGLNLAITKQITGNVGTNDVSN